MNGLIQPLKRTFSTIFYKANGKGHPGKSGSILYKIVDSYVDQSEEYYKVQCINTKAMFDATLYDLVFDLDILHGLHPIQGCYIGIEYAKVLKTAAKNPSARAQPKDAFTQYSSCGYGNNNLLYQDRNGLLCFECKTTGAQCLMDPRDIALSRELIEEFDAAEAFCIGVLAGLKLVSPIHPTRRKASHLRLVE